MIPKSPKLLSILMFVYYFIISMPVSLLSQRDLSREILVYFQTGVERQALGRSARITNHDIIELMNLHGLQGSDVVSAFPDFSESDTLATGVNGRQFKVMNFAKVFRITVPNQKVRLQIINALNNLPAVLFAEKNGANKPDYIPNDEYFYLQWGLDNTDPGDEQYDIDAPEAWDIYRGNPSGSHIIAVIDGGVRPDHEDLAGKVTGDTGQGSGFWVGHGTAVAGIAAAHTDNVHGIAGVDWYADIHAQRVDAGGSTLTAQAVMDAVNFSSNVFVLNNSFHQGVGSPITRAAYAYAYMMNRTVVASMGNTGIEEVLYPAAYGQGIIAVGNINNGGQRGSTSTWGSHIDIAAPGVGSIAPDWPDASSPIDAYDDDWTGTSFAAPLVSGIASLLAGYADDSLGITLYNDDIENILKLSAYKYFYPFDSDGWSQWVGHGIAKARGALDLIRSPNILSHMSSTGGTAVATSNFIDNFFFYSETGGDAVKRITVEKDITFTQSYSVAPNVWGRGAATTGYSTDNPNFSMGYTEVVPGTITTTGARLRTYYYDIYIQDPYDGHYDYYGSTPVNNAGSVQFAYTVLGDPPPAKPTGLSVTSVPGNHYEYSPKLSWNANSEPDLWRYKVTRTPDNTTWYTTNTYIIDYDVEVCPYDEVYYTVWAEDSSSQFSDPATKTADGCLGKRMAGSLEPFDAIPVAFALSPAHPNPFNPVTTIDYALPEASQVQLTVYNLAGRAVATLVGSRVDAGYKSAVWQGRDAAGRAVPSGVYLYRIVATGLESGERFIQTRKMVLLK